MAYQYMPKILHDPHKNPPPPSSFLHLNVRSLMTCFIDWMFLLWWAIAVSDFSPLEIYKNLALVLSTITFTVNSHADNRFCKYIYLFQILHRMKWFIFRSSRLEVFCRKGVLRNFIEFTGKHLLQSLFLNKFAGLTDSGTAVFL